MSRAYFLVPLLCCSVFFYIRSEKDLRKTLNRFAPSRYNSDNPLETITPSYIPHSKAIERPSARSASTCESNCSWSLSRTNSEFKSTFDYRKPFQIDDTAEVTAMNETMVCAPELFGYSVEMGEAVFPRYRYPTCQSLIQAPQPSISINITAGTFSMHCPNGVPGTYLLNPAHLLHNGQYFFHDLDWQVQAYPGHEVELQGSEFVYGSCGDGFTQAQYIPSFQEKAETRAKKIMTTKGVKNKPLAIVFLSVDSFSRRHFFRKLENTVSALNSLNSKPDFSVFDFKLHNVLGATSVENMIPMFGNSSVLEEENPPFEDLLGEGSLWRILKENGYVTMLGFENCDYHFPAALGKLVEVDHFIRNFYCAATKFLNVKMSKGGTVQRCIGSQMSHYYMLNYTKAFSNAYKAANQFIYLHLNAAHEETGQHAATLDADLTGFLNEYLPQISETHDLALFLQGDHGMRYGNWYKDIEAYQENKLPALFLIGNDGLLDRFPNAYDVLWHNTKRLVSKRDLRATILGLALAPYGTEYPVHNEGYLARDYNLVAEKVKDSRTCEELDIAPWYCSCLVLREVDPDVYTSNTDPDLNDLLITVATETITLINREVFTPQKLGLGLCQKLSFRAVLKSYGLKLGSKLEQIQLEFGVNESLEARFEVYAVVGTEKKSHFMKLDKARDPLIPVVYRGHQARMRVTLTQIIGVQRKDKYKGECEVISRAKGLRGELCVCNDLAQLRQSVPALFEED